MLDVVCYILAVVAWLIATLAPNSAAFDRARFIAAGLVAFALPLLVNAAQHH
jgi:hypothetical protein